jgi:hypothetical protein
MPAGRMGEPCPIYGCQAILTRRDGPSLVCGRGHWVVDRDAEPSHGVHWITPRTKEEG